MGYFAYVATIREKQTLDLNFRYNKNFILYKGSTDKSKVPEPGGL